MRNGFFVIVVLKSVNLQYNTLVDWDTGMNYSSTKCLMFQALFFSLFLIELGHSKLLLFYHKKIRKSIETIFAKNFARNYEKK